MTTVHDLKITSVNFWQIDFVDPYKLVVMQYFELVEKLYSGLAFVVCLSQKKCPVALTDEEIKLFTIKLVTKILACSSLFPIHDRVIISIEQFLVGSERWGGRGAEFVLSHELYQYVCAENPHRQVSIYHRHYIPHAHLLANSEKNYRPSRRKYLQKTLSAYTLEFGMNAWRLSLRVIHLTGAKPSCQVVPIQLSNQYDFFAINACASGAKKIVRKLHSRWQQSPRSLVQDKYIEKTIGSHQNQFAFRHAKQ